jgi:RNase P subunit RPR2
MKNIPCPICKTPLRVGLARSRKATRKKVFIMWVCPVDGRHARLFINDQAYVRKMLETLEQVQNPSTGVDS